MTHHPAGFTTRHSIDMPITPQNTLRIINPNREKCNSFSKKSVLNDASSRSAKKFEKKKRKKPASKKDLPNLKDQGEKESEDSIIRGRKDSHSSRK